MNGKHLEKQLSGVSTSCIDYVSQRVNSIPRPIIQDSITLLLLPVPLFLSFF